jgi:ABC-2 type transport system ATP-binding protein
VSQIAVQNLSKNYGNHSAVNDITFKIEPGEVVGFLGPNGAGKSTTMKMLTGFIAPSAGRAFIADIDVLKSPLDAQRQLGYLPENAPIYPDMNVKDYLNYIGRIRKLGRAERAHAIEQIIDQVGIRDRMGQSISQLSKGYRQRVGLAQALLHRPPIVILDEPTSGLDPNQIREIRRLIKEIGKNRTVILSTHILSEVQATCDRVIIIDKGQLVADGAVDDIILRAQGGLQIIVSFEQKKLQLSNEQISDALLKLEGITGVKSIEGMGTEQRFQLQVQRDLRSEVFHFAVSQGLSLIELQLSRSDLEDVFRLLTENDLK